MPPTLGARLLTSKLGITETISTDGPYHYVSKAELVTRGDELLGRRRITTPERIMDQHRGRNLTKDPSMISNPPSEDATMMQGSGATCFNNKLQNWEVHKLPD